MSIKTAIEARGKATPGPWYKQETLRPGIGIRTKQGFVCFMHDIAQYPNQEERYAQEQAERQADIDLITAAPDMAVWIEKALPWIKEAIDARNRAVDNAVKLGLNKPAIGKTIYELDALIREATE